MLDAELLERALTHRSYAYENGGLPTNERLEFLGDSVLGVVVTETLYRTHPDLSEGRLAKLRAAVVNARALAEVARTSASASTSCSAAARRPPAAATSPRSCPTRSRRVIGAVYLTGGFEAAGEVVHRLFDPLMAAAAAPRRRPGLEDQPAGALRRALARRPGVRHRGRAAPTTRRPSPPRSGSATASTATAPAGPRRRPSSRPPRRPTAPSPRAHGGVDPAPELDGLEPPCPSCPRSRSSAAASRRHVVGRTIAAVEVLHPRPVRRHLGRRRRLRGRARPAARCSAPRRRGKYLWLPLDSGDALLGHLGMSGQMLVQPAGAARRAAPAGAVRASTDDRAASCGSSTSGCSAASRSRRTAPTCRPRSRTSPATRSTRCSTTTRSWPRVRRRTSGIKRILLDQTADLRRRQHLRRRGAVARPAARRPARRQLRRARGAAGAGRRPRR